MDPIALFRSNWQTYQKIVEHNYMFHDELFSACHQLIKGIHKPLTILDLGCGDASLTKQLLTNIKVERYIACDLSENALELAKENLEFLGNLAKFNCIDMLEQLRLTPDQSIDLVFSSYAVHHLSDTDKAILFTECKRILKPSGYVVLIDVMRNNLQERAIYLKEYLGAVQSEWKAIDPAEFDRIAEHVIANDFPLSPSEYEGLAFQAGLKNISRLDAHGFHQAWAYQHLG